MTDSDLTSKPKDPPDAPRGTDQRPSGSKGDNASNRGERPSLSTKEWAGKLTSGEGLSGDELADVASGAVDLVTPDGQWRDAPVDRTSLSQGPQGDTAGNRGSAGPEARSDGAGTSRQPDGAKERSSASATDRHALDPVARSEARLAKATGGPFGGNGPGDTREKLSSPGPTKEAGLDGASPREGSITTRNNSDGSTTTVGRSGEKTTISQDAKTIVTQRPDGSMSVTARNGDGSYSTWNSDGSTSNAGGDWKTSEKNGAQVSVRSDGQARITQKSDGSMSATVRNDDGSKTTWRSDGSMSHSRKADAARQSRGRNRADAGADRSQRGSSPPNASGSQREAGPAQKERVPPVDASNREVRKEEATEKEDGGGDRGSPPPRVNAVRPEVASRSTPSAGPESPGTDGTAGGAPSDARPGEGSTSAAPQETTNAHRPEAPGEGGKQTTERPPGVEKDPAGVEGKTPRTGGSGKTDGPSAEKEDARPGSADKRVPSNVPTVPGLGPRGDAQKDTAAGGAQDSKPEPKPSHDGPVDPLGKTDPAGAADAKDAGPGRGGTVDGSAGGKGDDNKRGQGAGNSADKPTGRNVQHADRSPEREKLRAEVDKAYQKMVELERQGKKFDSDGRYTREYRAALDKHEAALHKKLDPMSRAAEGRLAVSRLNEAKIKMEGMRNSGRAFKADGTPTDKYAALEKEAARLQARVDHWKASAPAPRPSAGAEAAAAPDPASPQVSPEAGHPKPSTPEPGPPSRAPSEAPAADAAKPTAEAGAGKRAEPPKAGGDALGAVKSAAKRAAGAIGSAVGGLVAGLVGDKVNRDVEKKGFDRQMKEFSPELQRSVNANREKIDAIKAQSPDGKAYANIPVTASSVEKYVLGPHGGDGIWSKGPESYEFHDNVTFSSEPQASTGKSEVTDRGFGFTVSKREDVVSVPVE